MAEAQKEFTSWKDLRAQLLSDLMDPSYRRMTQYSVNAAGSGGAFSVTYRNAADLKSLIQLCEEEILKEEGAYLRRTYAKNGGRG
jgi:hypothetical protein